MKRIIIFLIAFISFYDNLYSQQYYDNGPIIENRENSRYSITTSKWNKPILGYYIYNSSSHLTFTERENAIRAAFDFFPVSDRCCIFRIFANNKFI